MEITTTSLGHQDEEITLLAVEINKATNPNSEDDFVKEALELSLHDGLQRYLSK